MIMPVCPEAGQIAVHVQGQIAEVDLPADPIQDPLADPVQDPSADQINYVRLMSFHIRDKLKAEDNYYEKNDTIGGFTIQQLLGEGRYGIVYLALDEENNKCVVKQLKKKMIKKNKSKLFYEELILKKLQQPCFPRFIDNFKDGDREGFVMEYMEGEVFEDILYKDKYQFRREEILVICSQLLDIVEQLHSCDIVHRDIRLPNVIRKNPGELSLIDFGLARKIDNTSHTIEEDFWYIGDFLIHLYYTTYRKASILERPWFKELELLPEELTLLRRLMGIDEAYGSISQIRQQLNKIKNKY